MERGSKLSRCLPSSESITCLRDQPVISLKGSSTTIGAKFLPSHSWRIHLVARTAKSIKYGVIRLMTVAS
ncbi:hypothetical protein AQUCO_06300031v1 [Aquilegia coerulea]|uniref:Uncharacterized protein n=1 Tax=Aquilegia coerulea TaxID=218851 RepID=A0A2G5CCR9_AQUCA|nr:hypothetical protein AQUCO_06300031v1 [Aquilegia coerulea]